MSKGYVVFDLSTFHGKGGAKFRSGTSLDRSDKARLEVGLASILLKSLNSFEGLSFANVRANSNDPPDVLVEFDGILGIELSELLPPNRLERDAILKRVRGDILKDLILSKHSRDWVITVILSDDYSNKLRLGNLAPMLSNAMNCFFNSETQSQRTTSIPVPSNVGGVVRRVDCVKCDLSNDGRITTRDEPLIVFSAQNTFVVPDRDFPVLLDQIIGKKGLQALSTKTWLLLWSNHYSFGPLEDQLIHHIGMYLDSGNLKYDRIFYLHHHSGGSIAEFR